MWDCGQDITSLPRVRTILDIMKQINIQLKVEITTKGSCQEFEVREVST